MIVRFRVLVGILLSAILVCSLSACAEEVATQDELSEAVVTRVLDGDTIEVSLGGKTEKIRLIGVDTPESVHPDETRNVPEGKMAAAFTKKQLEGEAIDLEFDVQERDKYGRLLAYVFVGDMLFNEFLVQEGFATVATVPPNIKYVDSFTAAEKEAQASNKGIWYKP